MRSKLKRIPHHVGTLLLPLAVCAAATIGLSTLFDAFDRRAEADPRATDDRTEDESLDLDDPIPDEAPRPADTRRLHQRDPFSPYRPDPSALTFEELSPAERARVESSQEWAEADSGDEVHQAFRRATTLGVIRARARSSERAIGLDGAATLGIN